MEKTENKQIGFCGWDCMKCGAYIAKRENNDALRRETSAIWKKELHLDIKPEDINCDGCLTELCGHADCTIRLCAREKGVLNCAFCKDYICAQLDTYFQKVPVCKEILDGIKQGIK